MSTSNLVFRSLLPGVAVVGAFLLARVEGPVERSLTMAPSAAIEGREDDPSARLEYDWTRLHDLSSGAIPDGIRARELAFAATLPRRVEATRPVLDKSVAVNGVASTLWTKRGPFNVGGRTRALAIDASNANTILAGGASGGMWRSLNGGISWSESTTPVQLHSVSCIAQDTRTGHLSTWYYGTGEYLGNSASGKGGAGYQGDGIFKSTDNGATWSLLASTSNGNPQSFSQFFDYVWNIVIDPTNAAQDIVYAAAYGAIYRSTDGGTSWNVVLAGSGTTQASMTDVQITSTGVLYATVSSDGGAQGGIYRSTNGTAWTRVVPADLPALYRRSVIGIAPSSENTVYVLVETPGSGYQTTYAGRNEAHSFWKYTYLSGDGTGAGGTWVNRSANLPNIGLPVGNFASQGSYDLVVRVKPDDPNTVFIGGTNLYRSTDGFATAITATGWIGGYATVNNVTQYVNHHPDQHGLVFAPGSPATLYSSHDGGISKTSDDLASAVVWSTLDRGYLTTQFYTVAIDHGTPGDNVVIGGMQDNGTYFTNSTSPSAPWVNEFGGDGSYCAVADGKTSYYVSSQNGTIYRGVLDASGGLTDYARVDPTGGTGYLFIAPFSLDPASTNVMYLAGGTALWRNTDLTGIPTFTTSPSTADNTTSVNWTSLTGASVAGTIGALGASRANPVHRLYFGGSTGKVYRLDNATTATSGSTATDVWTGKGLPAGYVSSIAVDPTNGDNALLTFSNYSILSVFYTNNGGTSWTAVSGNLEQNPDGSGNGPSVRWGAILPFGASTYYYVGTSTGLYSTMTLNGGSTVWAQEGSSTIENVVVDMIDTRQSDGLVVAGTHGQGVFSGIASPNAVVDPELRPVTTALNQNYPNPFNPSTRIGFRVQSAGKVTLKVYDVSGREVARLVDGHRPAGEYEVEFAPKNLASGMYIYRLEAGNFTESRKLLYLR